MAKPKEPAAPAAAKSAKNGKDGDDKPIRNLYLVDGSGYLFRAYHALPPMNRPDGTPINAVFGFCRMLVADLLDKPEVDHVAMILDAGSVTFRNKIYDKYKANRPDPPEDLIPQFPLIREAAKAFNVTVCELDGYEADDLIATYGPPGRRSWCHLHHRVLRQGPDAAHPAGRGDDGPDQEDQARARGGDGEVRRHAGQGGRRAGAWPAIRPTTCRACPASASRQRPSSSTSTAISRRCSSAPARSSSPSAARPCSPMPSWRASRANWSSSGTTCPPPPNPRPSTRGKPDPNVLLPWLEQQGFKSLLTRFTTELGEATSPVAPAAPPVQPALPAPEPKPAPAARAKTNQPFTAADYELIQDEKALDEWVAEATRAGVVAFDCETDALDSNNAGLVGVSLALLEGRGATSIRLAGARLTCRSAIVRRAARRRARSIWAATVPRIATASCCRASCR